MGEPWNPVGRPNEAAASQAGQQPAPQPGEWQGGQSWSPTGQPAQQWPPNQQWQPTQRTGPAPQPQPDARYGPPAEYGPPGHPNPPALRSARPAGNRNGRTGPLLLGIAVGLVLAIVVGGVLVLTKVAHFGSTAAAGPDTRPINLPASLSGVSDVLEAQRARGAKPEIIARQKTRMDNTARRTAEAYQRAFHGAAAAERAYADADLGFLPTVIAVRADAPGLVDGPVSDPADLGLAVLPHSVQAFGDVECEMYPAKGAIPAGQTVGPDDVLPSICQLTGGGATVWVTGISKSAQQVVDLAKAAHAAVLAG